jgi:hypothetical protein
MEFVMRAQTTENFRALCREYGISPRVGYKWSRRFVLHGLEGLQEESRKPKYPGIESRRVKANGSIDFRSKWYFLRTALAGWDVGLSPVASGCWEVRFGRLVLGHLEEATEAFLPIVAQTSQEVPQAA